MTTSQHNHHGLKSQCGSALVVSLLILLVLTLIGVTSMTTTTLQSKMATNSREYNLAFQASESALRYGEAQLSGANPPTGFDAACTGGLCLPATNGTPVWSTTITNWANAQVYGATTAILPDIPAAQQPTYLIEKLPPVSLQGRKISNLSNYGSGPTVQYYRVTASGTGANGSASVMVQSIYQP